MKRVKALSNSKRIPSRDEYRSYDGAHSISAVHVALAHPLLFGRDEPAAFAENHRDTEDTEVAQRSHGKRLFVQSRSEVDR